MQFNYSTSAFHPQADAPASTSADTTHQHTFMPSANQNVYVDFPPDYASAISANNASGRATEDTQTRHNANEFSSSVPRNFALYPQQRSYVAPGRNFQTSTEYLGLQVPGAYPVASHHLMSGVGGSPFPRSAGLPMPNSNTPYPDRTVVHQGPCVMNGISIGQNIAFNNAGHSGIPSVNSNQNIPHVPIRYGNNASQFPNNAGTSALSQDLRVPNVLRAISYHKENNHTGTGADLSVFNPKTPNISHVPNYWEGTCTSCQFHQNAGMPISHSNHRNISQMTGYQMDQSFVRIAHSNTRPLANVIRQNQYQFGDRAAPVAYFNFQNVPRISRTHPDLQNVANRHEQLTVPSKKPAQEQFDDPDAEGSPDNELYGSADLSAIPQPDLTKHLGASAVITGVNPTTSLNTQQQLKDRRPDAAKYFEKKYGIQLHPQDYKFLNQGKNSQSKNENNVKSADNNLHRPTTRDNQAPFAQGSSRDGENEQEHSSRKRQREEEIGAVPTARPTQRRRRAEPNSAQPPNANTPPPIEVDTSFCGEKRPEDAFFNGSRCLYRQLRTGKPCTKVITLKRGRYRHLATHAQREENLVDAGLLPEGEAVLLRRLPKKVLACGVEGCGWKWEVWRSDKIRETHEKQNHPEIYAKRLADKHKKKKKQENNDVEEPESESSDAETETEP